LFRARKLKGQIGALKQQKKPKTGPMSTEKYSHLRNRPALDACEVRETRQNPRKINRRNGHEQNRARSDHCGNLGSGLDRRQPGRRSGKP
jgi:hypothetical protein